MQAGHSLDAIAPTSVGAALTCLFLVKLALLTAILLLSAEWLPAGWRRRRCVLLCVVAMAADLMGTATVLALDDLPGRAAASHPVATPSERKDAINR